MQMWTQRYIITYYCSKYYLKWLHVHMHDN